MDLRVGSSFTFDVPVTTHAVVVIEPNVSETDRVVESRFGLEPHEPSATYVDAYGNRCRRLTLEPGTVRLWFDATVTVDPTPDPVDETAPAWTPGALPDDALAFLLPSRYCESDLLAPLAAATFGHVPCGWAQVQAVCDWVHEHVSFDYDSASTHHTAVSVLRDRRGVCRDYTHAAIALCRALNVPARYVCGYLPDIGVPDPGTPMDFCAWMEVYLGDRWHTFDPRNNQRRIGRVVVGRGRDAADVAMVTTFGQVWLHDLTVWADQLRTAPVARTR